MAGAARTVAIGLWALPVLALGACASSKPVTITLSSGDVLRGGATTNLNGQYFVKNQRMTCSGTYEGRNVAGVGFSVGRKAAVTVSCSNGKTGSSQDALYDTGTAQLNFSDGSKGRITLGEAQ